MVTHKDSCENEEEEEMDPGADQSNMSGTLGEGNGNNNELVVPDKSLEGPNPEACLSIETTENGETRTTTTTTETSVENLSTKPEPETPSTHLQNQVIIHEDIKVKNVSAVQVNITSSLRTASMDGSQDSAALGATASLPQSSNPLSPGKVLVYRNVNLHVENCKFVQVGDNNSMVIQKVTPQEDAFVKACCELDIDHKTADDIREKLSRADVLEQFAKKMAETYSVTCRIRSATKGCILLELEVPTEADRLQLLRMARDGTFQQVLLETFLPEFSAEGRAVNMNLAIGVRNPSQDMVQEIQGAVASSGNEDVVVVEITNDPNAASKQSQPESTEGGSSEQSDGQHEEDFAKGHKDISAEDQLPEVASSKPAPYPDIPTLSKKLLPEAEDVEGEITVSIEGCAEALPLETGAAAANFQPEDFDDKFLTCDICQNIFDDPRILPCHHTFCARCLKKWCKGKSQFTCPTCREQVSIQGTGVSSIPADFYKKKLLDFRASQKSKEAYAQCQLCESGARVAGLCSECYLFLCKSCIAIHAKAPVMKEHHITLLESPGEFCPKHTDQPMAFYCQPCDKFLCEDCINTEHQPGPDHDPQGVSGAAQKCKTELQTLAGETQTQLKETEDSLKKDLICITTNCELEKKKIHDHFVQLRAKLDKEEQEITNRLQNMVEGQKNPLLDALEAFGGTSKSTEDGVQFCKDIIARGSDVEMLTLGQKLKDNLNHLRTFEIIHRGLYNQISFNQNRQYYSRSLNEGQLTYTYLAVMVTELPVESLPTTFIYRYPWPHQQTAPVTLTVLPLREPDIPDDRYFLQRLNQSPVPEEQCVRLDTTRISDGVFEATWRPQTSGKHMVGITARGQLGQAVWDGNICTPTTIDVACNNPVLRFGQNGSQREQFDTPIDVAVSGDRLYVADTHNQRVQVFDLVGNFSLSFPTPANSKSLAVQSDGTIVVRSGKEVIRFSPSGELLHKFPLGEYCTDPYGLAVQRDGRVVVADPNKHSIFLFEADGTLVKQVGGQGEGEGQFGGPYFVCMDKEDSIIVADKDNSRVQVFDKNLSFKHKFGQKGRQPQDMWGPTGVSADSRGNIVLANIGEVSDTGGIEHGKKLQVFRPDGTWVSTISSDGDKLNKPHGVAVTEDGHVLVADSKDHCIRKYRYM